MADPCRPSNAGLGFELGRDREMHTTPDAVKGVRRVVYGSMGRCGQWALLAGATALV